MVGFNFAPIGWAFCNGALLSIAENSALYAVIGTTYGGDGVTTFALPNLQCRIPIHQGTGGGASYVIGQISGVEGVSLTGSQVPQHTHTFAGTTAAGTTTAPTTTSVPATVPTATEPIYSTDTASLVSMAPTNIAGTGTPHDNLMPYLCVNYIIALEGVFPTQN